MKTLALSSLVSLCLFAQGDGFTPFSGMGFDSDGTFNVGMEMQVGDPLPDGDASIADRSVAELDKFGAPIFPKRISFSGSASLRPRIPNYGWFGSRYVFKEDSLILLTLENSAGQRYVLFTAILKANSESDTVYVQPHVEPNLGSFPTSPSGAPLHLHLHIEMAGRGGANTELRFHGRWE